ncbi:MAG: TonB-dependent receptor domain-containing protein [Bradyrhizobium sp.]
MGQRYQELRHQPLLRLDLQGCLLRGNDALCPLIHRGNIGQLFGFTGYAVETNTNFGELHNRGIDLNLSYLRPLPRDWGSIGLTMTGSYLLEQAVSTVIAYDCAGLYGPVCSAGGDPGPNFRWRHDARITWLTPWNLDLSLNWRYLSSASLDLNSSQPALFAGVYDTYPVDAVLPAYSYLDFSAAWKALKWLTLRFGVNNVFDKDPPINSDYAVYNNNGGANGNVYTGTYDSLGREMYLTINARF